VWPAGTSDADERGDPRNIPLLTVDGRLARGVEHRIRIVGPADLGRIWARGSRFRLSNDFR